MEAMDAQPKPQSTANPAPPRPTAYRRRTARPFLLAGTTLVMAGLLLFTSPGCRSGADGPLPDSVMVQGLMEIHLLRARTLYRRNNENADSIMALQDSALLRRGISPSAFRANLETYAKEPERYQDVYTSLVDSLNSLRVRLSAAARDSSLLDSMIRVPPSGAYPVREP